MKNEKRLTDLQCYIEIIKHLKKEKKTLLSIALSVSAPIISSFIVSTLQGVKTYYVRRDTKEVVIK